jgi:DNA-binding response OmpR family regulator
VHVKSLRRKLKPADDLLETVRGVGYRFKERRE